MRAVMEYETNYINAAGFWMAFHEAFISLRREALTAGSDDEAQKCDIWDLVAIRYGLRVVGLRSEFYKMASKDPVHVKMVLRSLEGRNDMAASEDLVEPLETLALHISTQWVNTVATLSVSNATKREKGKGGPAGDQKSPLAHVRLGSIHKRDSKHGAGASACLCRAIPFEIYEAPQPWS